jgi:hypothetical protein
MTDREKATWRAGYVQGLEEAAFRIEQMGGKYSSLLSPGVAAREIRALCRQPEMSRSLPSVSEAGGAALQPAGIKPIA